MYLVFDVHFEAKEKMKLFLGYSVNDDDYALAEDECRGDVIEQACRYWGAQPDELQSWCWGLAMHEDSDGNVQAC